LDLVATVAFGPVEGGIGTTEQTALGGVAGADGHADADRHRERVGDVPPRVRGHGAPEPLQAVHGLGGADPGEHDDELLAGQPRGAPRWSRRAPAGSGPAPRAARTPAPSRPGGTPCTSRTPGRGPRPLRTVRPAPGGP